MDLTWKKVMKIPFDWNTSEVIQERKEYEYLGKLGMSAGRPSRSEF